MKPNDLVTVEIVGRYATLHAVVRRKDVPHENEYITMRRKPVGACRRVVWKDSPPRFVVSI
jgi:hypothetical protein